MKRWVANVLGTEKQMSMLDLSYTKKKKYCQQHDLL